MAALSLLFLAPLLSSLLLPASAQAIVSTSSSSDPSLRLPPGSYTPYPADDDVLRDGLADRDGTNEVPQEEPRRTSPSDARPTASSLSTLGSGPLLLTRPTAASKPRSDTAGLAFSRATRGPTLPRPTTVTTRTTVTTGTTTTATTPSSRVTNPAGGDDAASEAQREEGGSGSDPVPTAARAERDRGGSPDPPETVGTEMARFQPQSQTAPSEEDGPSLKMAEAQTPTALSVTVKPSPSALTRDGTTTSTPSPPETKATLNPAAPRTTTRPAVLAGELTAITLATETTTPRQESTTTGTVEPRTTSTTQASATSPRPNDTTTTTTRGAATTTTPATYVNITLQPTAVRMSAATNRQPTNATLQPGRTTTTAQSAKTGNTPSRSTTTSTSTTSSTTVGPVGRGRPGGDAGIVTQRNRSVPLGRPAPPTPTPTPSPAPSPPPPPPPSSSSPPNNGTLLRWDDLSRTLAFAWQLHVYGTASLFLLLFAGAALGLALAPGMSCPHRGALALANALLFLAGGLRAALFLIDPYGARQLIPRAGVTALYNLPLHLLVWAQAALALLSLRVVEVSALPPTLERPPLVAVLAVLQCTLLLAADLLSPALSPAVPVTLQVLSLCWGLAVCLGFLCYVFPRLRSPANAVAAPLAGTGTAPPAGGEAEGKPCWTRGTRTGLILGRVLAVCALLGALCCGLHVHATLWLYGLLGEWRRFNWGWWLVHFWARLLELAWGFSLLLLGSWVFWRPSGGPGSEEGGAGDGRAGGELPSPGQSAASSHRHTCWSKIVQSLTGKPCKKSESNGVGGAGGAGGGGVGGGGGGPGGEVPPNNWAGLLHERLPPAGADISKSLIRNQNNHEQQHHVKDSNHGRNQRGRSAERGGGVFSDGSTGSLLRLQSLGGRGGGGGGGPPQQQDSHKDLTDPSSLSLYEFDLRPPSPIDLGRSIDDALHREHLLGAGSLFQPLSLGPSSPYAPPSPGYGYANNTSSSQGSGGPWLRRNNSDPQLLLSDDSSDAQTESSAPLGGGSVMSSVPSRQVTAPPTPSHHQGERRWDAGSSGVPSSVSCPVSLRPSSRTASTGQLGGEGEGEEGVSDDTRPFLTPDSDRLGRGGGRGHGGGGKYAQVQGSRSYLEVSRLDDTNSVSSEIIDL